MAGGDGAYDRREDYDAIADAEEEAVIPPRRGARIWRHGDSHAPPLIRDEHPRRIREIGRKRRKRESGYSRRSLAETAFSRLKRLFGERLRGRVFENQASGAFLMPAAINVMTLLGMPDSHPVC